MRRIGTGYHRLVKAFAEDSQTAEIREQAIREEARARAMWNGKELEAEPINSSQQLRKNWRHMSLDEYQQHQQQQQAKALFERKALTEKQSRIVHCLHDPQREDETNTEYQNRVNS